MGKEKDKVWDKEREKEWDKVWEKERNKEQDKEWEKMAWLAPIMDGKIMTTIITMTTMNMEKRNTAMTT